MKLELIQKDGTYNTIEKVEYRYVNEPSINQYVLDNIEYLSKYKSTFLAN
jgi:hypothetical protein